jgi:hypothetical protein
VSLVPLTNAPCLSVFFPPLWVGGVQDSARIDMRLFRDSMPAKLRRQVDEMYASSEEEEEEEEGEEEEEEGSTGKWRLHWQILLDACLPACLPACLLACLPAVCDLDEMVVICCDSLFGRCYLVLLPSCTCCC